MLSRSIKNTADVLTTECADGIAFAPSLQWRIVGLMRVWEVIAAGLEGRSPVPGFAWRGHAIRPVMLTPRPGNDNVAPQELQ
ncbi:hypothetical protein AN189_02980 [Loktanella sp. 3ANDIMAR09]|uniref:hypothetical protein n=1 Tax=Loktanella sp. 3ANDIMAR09 TaxID=1225657 RepID=UPI0006FF4C01|nr:hypothetical protein [Loktanella sp. 3ANDIMAR09]KQI69401.1 hypothetical protein AN189_02980 [Loktanella sp. 3ANDIMAR09]